MVFKVILFAIFWQKPTCTLKHLLWGWHSISLFPMQQIIGSFPPGEEKLQLLPMTNGNLVWIHSHRLISDWFGMRSLGFLPSRGNQYRLGGIRKSELLIFLSYFTSFIHHQHPNFLHHSLEPLHDASLRADQHSRLAGGVSLVLQAKALSDPKPEEMAHPPPASNFCFFISSRWWWVHRWHCYFQANTVDLKW